jgi:hypothetical protein
MRVSIVVSADVPGSADRGPDVIKSTECPAGYPYRGRVVGEPESGDERHADHGLDVGFK